MVAAGVEHRQLHAGAKRSKARDHEVVHVRVRQPAEDPARREGALVEEIEVDPPERRRDDEAGGCGGA